MAINGPIFNEKVGVNLKCTVCANIEKSLDIPYNRLDFIQRLWIIFSN